MKEKVVMRNLNRLVTQKVVMRNLNRLVTQNVVKSRAHLAMKFLLRTTKKQC